MIFFEFYTPIVFYEDLRPSFQQTTSLKGFAFG